MFCHYSQENHFWPLHPHVSVAKGLTVTSDSVGFVSVFTCSSSEVFLKLWISSGQLNSLDGASAHIKVSAYAGQHKHRKAPKYIHDLCRIQTHDPMILNNISILHNKEGL
jgi:hypothetical protein